MAGAPSPELVVLVGLQGAGKSTFYRERFAQTHAHVSGDLLRNNRRPARRQLQLVEEALAQGRSAVLDNTNAAAAARAPYLEIARRHQARAIACFFTPDIEASLERNAARPGEARVPAVALYATRKKLEPPSFAEGFSRIFDVEIAPGGGFQVSERSPRETPPAGPPEWPEPAQTGYARGMAKPPSVETKEIAELQAKLVKLQQQHASGKVAQSEEVARAFLEQVSALAAKIAEMGNAVVKGDTQKRKELQEQAEAIQSLLRHLPGMKG